PSRIVAVEIDDREFERIEDRQIRIRPPALEGAEKQLVDDDRRSRQIFKPLVPGSPRQWRSIVTQQSDNRVGVEQIPHHGKSLSSSGRSCCGTGSLMASMTSSSIFPTRASSQAQSPATGSRITVLPRLRMRTSLPSKRNSLGRRTACERPDQKSFAVAVAMSRLSARYQKYIAGRRRSATVRPVNVSRPPRSSG